MFSLEDIMAVYILIYSVFLHLTYIWQQIRLLKNSNNNITINLCLLKDPLIFNLFISYFSIIIQIEGVVCLYDLRFWFVEPFKKFFRNLKLGFPAKLEA